MMVKTKKYIGFRPYSFQKAVIDVLANAKGTGITVTVKSRRQVGKSMLIQNILLYYAINYERSNSAVLSPTFNQARKIYKEMVDAISASRNH